MHLKTMFRQMLQQFRQPAITEAHVIRPGLGEKRFITWAVFHLPAQLIGQLRQMARLIRGSFDLPI